MPFTVHANNWQARKAKAMLSALLEIVRDEEIPYDFYISKMIWGVSLYLESGGYKENWKTRVRASDEAIKLRESDKNWRKLVTFEHSRTLHDIFHLLRRGGPISLDEAALIISEYPPILVTKKENSSMNSRGFKKSGVPEERYDGIAIRTFDLRAMQTSIYKD